MTRFPTIPSSSNSRFLSSTFVLSKISLSLFKLSSVFLFSFSMSCFWFSLSMMVMVPLDTADVVVVPALSFDGRYECIQDAYSIKKKYKITLPLYQLKPLL